MCFPNNPTRILCCSFLSLFSSSSTSKFLSSHYNGATHTSYSWKWSMYWSTIECPSKNTGLVPLKRVVDHIFGSLEAVDFGLESSAASCTAPRSQTKRVGSASTRNKDLADFAAKRRSLCKLYQIPTIAWKFSQNNLEPIWCCLGCKEIPTHRCIQLASQDWAWSGSKTFSVWLFQSCQKIHYGWPVCPNWSLKPTRC